MAEEIAGILRREILSGELDPGTPLPQNQLAERFSTSTTPIREALRVLRQEGLAIGPSHRRVVVYRPTLHDIRENTEMRIALETLATRLAVPHLDEDTLATLNGLLADMKAAGNQDAEHYPQLNRAFHLTLYAAADRPRLSAMIAELRGAASGYLRMFADISGDPASTEREHQAIYDACAAGAAQEAAALMEAHLQHLLTTISRHLIEVDETE
jgi:DNA-binding GntR family transcriptional regulator